jgi:hypothetical protein
MGRRRINNFFLFFSFGDTMANTNPINNKVTYRNKGTNAGAIAASGVLAIEAQTDALKNQNLPHNTFVMTNQSTTCTLFLFLDDYSDATKPDYVVFPTQTIAVALEDGVSFTTLWVRNTHAATSVAIGELKYNIMTIKEIR